MGRQFYEDDVGSAWNPANWTKKMWAIVAAVAAVIIAVVVAVAVVVTKNNKSSSYPDYSTLTYNLVDTYSGEDFFDNFDYFTGYDPASGFVHYVPNATAISLNLTSASASSAVVRVDTSVSNTSVPNASTGRFSVRIESKKQYTDGLFIFEIKHTPYGCGTWPALWMVDPNNDIWPAHGEIDIMEAVNLADDGNAMTLHTSGDCTMAGVTRKMTGSVAQADCHNTTNSNAGCGVEASDDSYGAAYNADGGGIVAVEWRDEGIRMWQFDESSTPSDIASGAPDPSTWGTATADFPNTKCDIGSHFSNASIVANIDLCGALGAAKYETSSCPKPCVDGYTCVGSSNCTDYVANNPDAFADAYWEFGSFKIYQTS